MAGQKLPQNRFISLELFHARQILSLPSRFGGRNNNTQAQMFLFSRKISCCMLLILWKRDSMVHTLVMSLLITSSTITQTWSSAIILRHTTEMHNTSELRQPLRNRRQFRESVSHSNIPPAFYVIDYNLCT